MVELYLHSLTRLNGNHTFIFTQRLLSHGFIEFTVSFLHVSNDMLTG
jgi:hypothetical protein